jgi:prostaglandin-endoperoxide synthase 2
MPDVKPPPLPTQVKQPGAVTKFVEELPTKGAPVWRVVQRVDPLERVVNRMLINKAINVLAPRPYRLSTKLDYTTYETLTNREYNTRQLPCSPNGRRTTPEIDRVVELFRRKDFIPCEKSTVLFAYFAQWFTDGFLRSNRKDGPEAPRDITRNESTHEVDLAQLYGLNEAETDMLRDPHNRILLAHQGEPGEELPPDLYSPDGKTKLEQFKNLRVITPAKKPIDNRQLLAMGSDAANIQVGYAMLNTLFLREHNRIAREIERTTTGWDEDRIFGAARSVLTVLLIRIVIEQYINHIHPFAFEFRLDPRGFDKQPWMRPNWVAVEFNLVYRWHSLIPDRLDIGRDEPVPVEATVYQSKALLAGDGFATIIDRASRQRAGRVGLKNTGKFLLDRAERASIEAGRTVRLRGYNEYREACKLGRVESFAEITPNPTLAKELKDVYGTVDEIEFFPGLFAENPRPNSVLPPLIGRLVGLHAFSQIMTNPLFGPEVYNTETFSERGAEIIAETKTLGDLVRRNIPQGSPVPEVRMTREGWKRRKV